MYTNGCWRVSWILLGELMAVTWLCRTCQPKPPFSCWVGVQTVSTGKNGLGRFSGGCWSIQKTSFGFPIQLFPSGVHNTQPIHKDDGGRHKMSGVQEHSVGARISADFLELQGHSTKRIRLGLRLGSCWFRVDSCALYLEVCFSVMLVHLTFLWFRGLSFQF